MGWLRDPLVLFLVLGAALGGLHWALQDEASPLQRETEIVVTDADVLWLQQVFEKTWQRPPTKAELRKLVDRRVRDELLYREAKALGLDQGDNALRRRLAMKLEFLAQDAGAAAVPTEAELRAYLEANPASYTRAGRRTFVHVYLNADKRGKAVEADATALLERLRTEAGFDASEAGDRIMLEFEQVGVAPRDVAATFGVEFSDALFAQESSRWVGPLRSGYGVHLVFVRDAEADRVPQLEEVRDQVQRDLVAERRDRALEAYVEALRDRYDVSLRTTLLSDDGE